MLQRAAFLIFLTTALVVSPARGQQLHVSEAEYAVYTFVLDSLFSEVVREVHWVAARTHRGTTEFGSRDLLSEALKQLTDVPPELIADFEVKNAEPAVLEADFFRTGHPVVVLDSAAVRRIGDETLDLDEYPASYPADVTVTFSRVGLTPDRQHALVHRWMHCGGRCGDSGLLYLRRENGVWVLKRWLQILQM